MTVFRLHLLAAPRLAAGGPGVRPPAPEMCPRGCRAYDIESDLDVAGPHRPFADAAPTWTNRYKTPAHELVFNAHSHYVVPASDIGFDAKMLEILRVTPSETLGVSTPLCEVTKITLDGKALRLTPFSYEGDTKTAARRAVAVRRRPERFRYHRVWTSRSTCRPSRAAGDNGKALQR